MSLRYIVVIFLFFVFYACNEEKEIIKEGWMERPMSEWPTFALTNKISFTDTTFTDLANSFLVDTGVDTIGVSCKHIFMVFQNRIGLKTIDLGTEFKYWNLYPKNNNDKILSIDKLINANKNEQIAQYNTLKDRDWIIFNIDRNEELIYPLKIRYSPIKKNEIVYAIGWGKTQKDNTLPQKTKLQCVDNLGNYYYVKNLSPDISQIGTSGSPIIDKNGYLVGIVSGAEGKLGVIGSVHYLKKMFDTYKIDYLQP